MNFNFHSETLRNSFYISVLSFAFDLMHLDKSVNTMLTRERLVSIKRSYTLKSCRFV